MKTILLSLITLLTIQSFAQPKNELAIRNILATQTAAWNRGEIDNFMNGYWENDSLMFIGKSGVTYGWTNTINNYKKGYPDTCIFPDTSKEAFRKVLPCYRKMALETFDR